jgi:macrolide-specific efflux system membrane fusion protein
MKKRNRWAWAIAAGALLFCAGVAAFFLRFNKKEAAFDYLQVERGSVREVLEQTGTVQPEHRLNVNPPIAGRVDSVEVENGQQVKQGQTLAWLSSTDRAAVMDAARAASPKEFAFWSEIYRPAPLLAPLDGRVIATNVVPGQYISATEPAFVMSDRLIVQADVDETDLHRIWEGQIAEMTLDGFPDARLRGKVGEIAHDSTLVNNVMIYTVKIFLDVIPNYLRSGLTANVFFSITERENAVRIPMSALTSDGSVWIASAKGAVPAEKRIETGIGGDGWIEVTKGLSEGDWIARRHYTIKSENSKTFSFLPDYSKLRRQRERNRIKENGEGTAPRPRQGND